MSGRETPWSLQWEEALRWLSKAAEDLAAARILLREGFADPAAFHAQQALEKILKALLVAAAQDIRRTHDLETLATAANVHWPHLVPSPFLLAELTNWYLISRYPGIDELPADLKDISEALQRVDRLLASVSAQAPSPDRKP